MPDLDFNVTGVEAAARGLTPLLHFQLEVSSRPEQEVVQAVLLHTQIQIQSPQRSYNAGEKERLGELFGTPDRWGQTLRNRLWTNAQATVGSFAGSAKAILPVQCTYDLNVVATKYLYALEGGEVPLLFLFSGTIFYAAEDGRLQVQQISWNKECGYRMPVRVWQELMEAHFPNSAWLWLQRDVFDRLYAYKRSQGLATWEQALERLLPATEREEVAA
jgi:hypothetical protein